MEKTMWGRIRGGEFYVSPRNPPEEWLPDGFGGKQANPAWAAYMAELNAEGARIESHFQAEAIKAVGLEGHPKAEAAYALAYERGHSSGFGEIYSELVDLAELLLG